MNLDHIRPCGDSLVCLGRSRLLKLALALHFVFASGDPSCTSDTQCSAAACAAESSLGCMATVCSATYGRCLCPGTAALRRFSGGCEAAVPASAGATCDASHDVVVVVGMWDGPEIQAAGVEDMDGAFGTMLRHCVAAALRKGIEEVAVSEVRRTKADVGQLGGLSAGSGLLLFDWEFAVCAEGGIASIDPYDFENQFSVKAQSFEAFSYATLRLLFAPRSRAPTSTTTWRPMASTTEAAHEAEAEGFRGLLEHVWWLPWAGAGVVCIMLGVTVVVIGHRHRRRWWAKLHEDFMAGPGGARLRRLPERAAVLPGDGGAAAPRALVQVAEDFRAPLGEGGGAEGYLALAQGDLVEVLAVGDGWLLGRRLGGEGAAGAAGFFPEACATWLERPDVDAESLPEAAANDLADALAQIAALGSLEGDSPTGMSGQVGGDRQASAGSAAASPSLGQVWEEGLSLSPPAFDNGGEPAASGPVVRVLHSFHPEEVREADDPEGLLRARCLALDGTEHVEVLAAGGGWLYGRLVHAGREGYFPEDRADWDPEAGIQTA
mmetsp:Transcript_141032/g.451008  ORF Transcript_141032/g.451008 Transcript_141032/m.451008 type:complete len:549 (-) Transcript_141032:233-1879(-)